MKKPNQTPSSRLRPNYDKQHSTKLQNNFGLARAWDSFLGGQSQYDVTLSHVTCLMCDGLCRAELLEIISKYP